jgi:predicted DNA-binding WGR domain protein
MEENQEFMHCIRTLYMNKSDISESVAQQSMLTFCKQRSGYVESVDAKQANKDCMYRL